jgi:predicted negative regulator of RcsB-dependent stress response
MVERRLTQKDIKQPDQFISFSIQAIAWAKSHTTYILYGLLGMVVGIGLIIGWSIWQTQRRHTAEVLLYEAMTLLKNDEKATGGVAAVSGQGQEQLQHITHDYRATPAAALAAWHLGHLHFKQGDFGAALAAYEQSRHWLPTGHTQIIPPLITLNIGYAQEAKGSCNNAIPSFEAVVKSTADWLHSEAFLGIGRCYEQTGEPTKALATYDRALSTTAVSGAIRQQIEERRTLLHTTQLSQRPPQALDTREAPTQDTPGKP